MKQSFCALVIMMVVVAPLLLAQQRPADAPQKQTVTFMVKDGDSLVPKNVDVVYAPKQGQDKQALPYDQAPEAKTTFQPKYPDAATKAGTEGNVWTKVSIDENGKVTKVVISKSDNEIFNQPSIDAAMKWEFRPALKDGKPMACEVAIPFRFKLAGKGYSPLDFTQSPKDPFYVSVSPLLGYQVMSQQPYLIGHSPSATSQLYPESALKDKFDGIVFLKLTINSGGRVERVEVEGHAREDLDSAAVRLARTWTFIPGQMWGVPEKSIIRVPVAFNLGKLSK
ncbi:MAG TPA: energy transducer TonB [Bacteroidota bacterium]|nr:energy transducer TonB [Bacteroidota bacterium]